MKSRILFLVAATFAIVGLPSCSDDDDVVAVEQVTVDPVELTIEIGETAKIAVTVSPSDAVYESIVWSSSDPTVATVDDGGNVVALAVGVTTVSATAGGMTAECVVTVNAPFVAPVIGDFYYSDGTWSSTLDPAKGAIGIVFWVGDPTANDAALRNDHPYCTHGLVMALDEQMSCWQSNYEVYNSTVSAWVKENAKQYAAPESTKDLDSPFQTIIGYNNTKAIEAFNAAPENASWPVEAVAKLTDYRAEIPAPLNSSDWYVPSPKELSLLCAGEMEGSIYIKKPIMTNAELLLPKIEEAGGMPFARKSTWSSTEAVDSANPFAREMAYNYAIYQANYPLSNSFKNWEEYAIVRFVLAF